MNFETYKTIVDAEVDAFNKICKDISLEMETNSKIIEEHHQALKYKIDVYEEDKRLLRNHMFAKYNINFVDINEMIVKFRYRTKYIGGYFQDKYVLEKLEAISNFNTKCDEIYKLKVKNSQLKNILAKVHHLTAEHFAYSSLEALKDVVEPEVIYSKLQSYHDRVPHSLCVNNIYAFPHNTETDVSYIDEKLVDLFWKIFKYQTIKTNHNENYFTSAYKLF